MSSQLGGLPKEWTSPIDKDDHPELGTSEELPETIKSSLVPSNVPCYPLDATWIHGIYGETMTMGDLMWHYVKATLSIFNAFMATFRSIRMMQFTSVPKFWITSNWIMSPTIELILSNHNDLVYHHLCEAVTSDAMWFFHIKGTDNPSAVLNKILGYCVFWPLIKPFLFLAWRTFAKPKSLCYPKLSPPSCTEGSVNQIRISNQLWLFSTPMCIYLPLL